MFKSKRRKELEAKELELHYLKVRIQEMKHWCAADSPEIGFAMLYLEGKDKDSGRVSEFRERIRDGKLTFDKYVEQSCKQ